VSALSAKRQSEDAVSGEAAMLLALAAAERLAVQGVEVRWALTTAAQLHVVDRAELPIRLLQKFVSVQRARATVASLREGGGRRQRRSESECAVRSSERVLVFLRPVRAAPSQKRASGRIFSGGSQ
jgi:hypothetical protein